MVSILKVVFCILDVFNAIVIMNGTYENNTGRNGAILLSILLIVSAMLIIFN